ncbi:N-acetylmuramoyl-L-alanine amidase [Mycolicibacterium austroafricanum]|nr:N-acetylmuramoyl-L-alanine amidase [Mycolicibacterium austroafricanum]
MGQIWGVMAHHTGSFGETPRGIAEHPSLGLASQLYLGKDGEYTLCGVGIAWHGGTGSYPGISDVNGTVIGIEAANDGGGNSSKPLVHRSSWPDVQYDAYVRGVAAILNKLGYGSDRVIGHKEWAGRSQGKWDPGQIDMNIFRADIAQRIGGGIWTDIYNEIMGVI